MNWSVGAYAKLGVIRDHMPDSEVQIIQDFSERQVLGGIDMTLETTEFERVPDMRGYYISSNGPSSGEFAPIKDYRKIESQLIESERKNQILMKLLEDLREESYPGSISMNMVEETDEALESIGE